MTSPLGKPPELRKVDKRLLKVDASYQRTIESARSRIVVQRIADNFDWLRFGVITTTKDFSVVDGQHRHAAAMRRDDVIDLPCLVLPITNAAEAAAIFVAINRDRTALTPIAIFKAELAAGNPEAKQIDAVAQRAGAEVLAYPLPMNKIKPHQTMSVATLRAMYRRSPALLEETLRACVESGAGLTALALQSAFRALSDGNGGDLPAQLRRMKGVQFEQNYSHEGSRADAFYQMMTGAIEIPAPKSAAAKQRVKKPFRFDRSKAGKKPPPPKPVEVRGDVTVRRFEPGTSTMLVQRALEQAGYELKNVIGGQFFNVRKVGVAGKPKKMNLRALMKFVDELRVQSGHQPIRSVG